MKITDIAEYLTYDDVLLLPGYSEFTRDAVTLSTKLTKKIELKIPLISSPMDTVTESELAIALGKLGGLGIIHRNLPITDQAKEVKKVVAESLPVGAAIGPGNGFEKRSEALIDAGVTILCIDSAHGHTKTTIETISSIKRHFPNVAVMAGNIATYDAARRLIDAGADCLRVGMGPGAICTTRVISGMGVPQLTALTETVRAAKSTGTPVIADGGIKYSGDMVKALAVGASLVMMGRIFASCQESPGKKITLTAEHVPARFKDILTEEKKSYMFKSYRGMGSESAMKTGAKIKSENEFHGKNYQDRVLVAEGVEGLVPVNGTVKDVVDQALGGIKSGMYYVGCKTIGELWKKARFIKITNASLIESHPHDVLITNAGKNYA